MLQGGLGPGVLGFCGLGLRVWGFGDDLGVEVLGRRTFSILIRG